jgi:hypothetical protein
VDEYLPNGAVTAGDRHTYQVWAFGSVIRDIAPTEALMRVVQIIRIDHRMRNGNKQSNRSD